MEFLLFLIFIILPINALTNSCTLFFNYNESSQLENMEAIAILSGMNLLINLFEGNYCGVAKGILLPPGLNEIDTLGSSMNRLFDLNGNYIGEKHISHLRTYYEGEVTISNQLEAERAFRLLQQGNAFQKNETNQYNSITMETTCAYCEGTGHKYGIHDSNTCPVCSGAGRVQVPAQHVVCSYCDGTGHKYGRHDSNICPNCNGVGVRGINIFG